ncbi:MAG: 2-dehydropantoate 2-reductase [Vicinamibacteria bacterium]
MKFAVFGSGGVGAYFGGRLAQAGHDVTFVARGAHLAAMLERGLRVESIDGDFTVSPVNATSDPSTLGPVDVVILAVKTWQVAESAALIAPLLRPDSAVLTLQNGVEAPSEVARVCGLQRVFGGVCRIMSFVAAPGVIRHAGVKPTVSFGPMNGQPSSLAEALRAALDGCQGVSAALSPHIQRELWEKFLFIAPFSAVGAVTRKPAGAWRSLPETRSLLKAAMQEVVDLAKARGVSITPETQAQTLEYVDRLHEDATASMQRDLLEGKPSELEAQTGAIVRLGAESGVPVPANTFLYAALLPGESQARKA